MPARDMAAYMRERRARQKAELKAEKEAIERRGGRPVFTTHSSGELGYRDGTKPHPAAAVTLARPDRAPSGSHSREGKHGRRGRRRAARSGRL